MNQIQLILEKPVYSSGEQINGVIKMNLAHNYPSEAVVLKIEGAEEVKLATKHWMTEGEYNSRYRYHGKNFRFWKPSIFRESTLDVDWNFWNQIPQKYTRKSGEDKEQQKRVILDHYKCTKLINDQKIIKKFDRFRGFIPAGSYTLPFSYVLPGGLPGTFSQEFEKYKKKCFANIQYRLTALIKSPDIKKISNLVDFLDLSVQENQSITNETYRARAQKGVYGLRNIFCNSLGVMKMKAYFEKPVYQHGETAYVVIELDQNTSQVDLKRIEVRLEQMIRFEAGSYRSHRETASVNMNVTGRIKAGGNFLGQNAIRLSLGVRDLNRGKDLPQTVQSAHIGCRYQLVVEAILDHNCLCCQKRPILTVPVTLVLDGSSAAAFNEHRERRRSLGRVMDYPGFSMGAERAQAYQRLRTQEPGINVDYPEDTR